MISDQIINYSKFKFSLNFNKFVFLFIFGTTLAPIKRRQGKVYMGMIIKDLASIQLFVIFALIVMGFGIIRIVKRRFED